VLLTPYFENVIISRYLDLFYAKNPKFTWYCLGLVVVQKVIANFLSGIGLVAPAEGLGKGWVAGMEVGVTAFGFGKRVFV